MKKFVCLLLIAVLSLSLFACGNGDKGKKSDFYSLLKHNFIESKTDSFDTYNYVINDKRSIDICINHVGTYNDQPIFIRGYLYQEGADFLMIFSSKNFTLDKNTSLEEYILNNSTYVNKLSIMYFT